MLRTRAAVICLGILTVAYAAMAETATEDIDGRRQALEPYFHTYRPIIVHYISATLRRYRPIFQMLSAKNHHIVRAIVDIEGDCDSLDTYAPAIRSSGGQQGWPSISVSAAGDDCSQNQRLDPQPEVNDCGSVASLNPSQGSCKPSSLRRASCQIRCSGPVADRHRLVGTTPPCPPCHVWS